MSKATAILLLFISLSFLGRAQDYQFRGGELGFNWINSNTLRISAFLRSYKPCGGAFNTPDSIRVYGFNQCGDSISSWLFNAGFNPSWPGWSRCEPPPQCDDMMRFGYENQFQIDSICDHWTFWIQEPIRWFNTQFKSDTGVLFTKVFGDSALSTGSLSAIGGGMWRGCLDNSGVFALGMTSSEGDSLTYSIGCPMESAEEIGRLMDSTICSHSTDSLFDVYSFDTITGTLRGFFYEYDGAHSIWVEVKVFDPKSSILIGIATREILLVADDCRNTAPKDSLGIHNFLSQNGSYYEGDSIWVQKNDSLSFELQFYDELAFKNDTLDSLIITSSVSNWPGANSVIIPESRHVSKIRISLTDTFVVNRNHSFFVQVTDDACPLPGFNLSPIHLIADWIPLPSSSWQDTDSNFEVYPNPTREYIVLNGFEGKQAIVSDLLGRVVLDERLVGESLDLSELEAGTFFLEIVDGGKSLFKTRILKVD